jgi:hypothetical protein
MSTKPGTKTTWVIDTVGGRIHRIFSTLETAKKWAKKQWNEYKLVIGPDDAEGTPVSHGIRYVGAERRSENDCWATIAERQHCPTCGHVIAERSHVKDAWSPKKPDFYVPRDLEDHPNEDVE